MANGVTAGTLWSRALDYADMTGSAFPDTTRKYDLLNAGIAKLHGLLASADYLTKTQTVTLVAGTTSYALDADFYKLQEVKYVQNSRTYPLKRFRRRTLFGVAAPRSAGTLEVDFAPQFTAVAADATTLDSAITDGGQVPNGWEDHVALTVAIRLLAREETDSSALRAERDGLSEDIRNHIGPRDVAGGTADVYGRWSLDELQANVGRGLVYDLRGQNLVIFETISRGV